MENKELIGKQIEAIPAPPIEMDIDVDDELIDALINSIDVGDTVDVNALDSFTAITQSRENIYSIIDTMAADDRVSAILETFTEDCVETNDEGKIIWCDCDDVAVTKYVNYLLDVLNVDKNAYEWMYSLLRYGDAYLRLYRQSDYDADNDFLFKEEENEKKTLNESLNPFAEIYEEEGYIEKSKEKLEEDVKVSIHAKNDHYVHYVELVPNPGEMFELTKFGKTRGYISAPIDIQSVTDYTTQYANYLTYKLKEKDVTVYGATDFVHASLRNTNNIRNPEEVRIFKNEDDYDTDSSAGVYKVKRGQSMLFNKFRSWRQLCMTENSILLDRVTKSALIRIISIETAGLPKNKVKEYIARMKDKIEQKISLSVNNNTMSNYTNPGPVVNSIFTPTRDGKGSINIQTLGGDYDPGQLTDLDHQETRFYGGFRVPKAYFNLTDDGAGFNGGQSLTILSSRYGKSIKQYQNIFIQMVTDLINLFCIDAGYSNYINKFKLKMQTPVTQEEIDKRDNVRNRMGVVGDIMNQVKDVEVDNFKKLKIYKELLASSITEPAVIEIIQERIDELEKDIEEKEIKDDKDKRDENKPSITINNEIKEPEISAEEASEVTPIEEPEEPETASSDSYLPNPNELGISFVDNEQ